MSTEYRVKSFLNPDGIEKWVIQFHRNEIDADGVWITLLRSFTEDMVFDHLDVAKSYAKALKEKNSYNPKIIYID